MHRPRHPEPRSRIRPGHRRLIRRLNRDKLAFNPDGSLDLYVQRESPGKDKEVNWLPTPASGPFTMNLRLYWPKPEVLNETWKPPMVVRTD